MNGKKLYVGNLTYSVTNQQLEELFAQYGEVVSVNIIEGKGFGFVEMGTQEEAEKAEQELNEKEFVGRNLKVNEARPPRNRSNNNFSRRY